MEITINIENDSKFNEVLSKELDAFTKEELHEICKTALLKYMSEPERFDYLFVNKDYGYTRPTALLEEAARKIDFQPLYKDIQEKIIQYIGENYQDIVKDIIKDMFIRGFENSIVYSADFAYKIKDRLHEL